MDVNDSIEGTGQLTLLKKALKLSKPTAVSIGLFENSPYAALAQGSRTAITLRTSKSSASRPDAGLATGLWPLRLGTSQGAQRQLYQEREVRIQAIFIRLEGGHLSSRHLDWWQLLSFARAQDLENALHREAPSQSGLH